MPALTDPPSMAKREDISVKIRPNVYRKVKTVAAWRGMHIADYLSEIVEPIVTRDMARMGREASKGSSDEDADE